MELSFYAKLILLVSCLTLAQSLENPCKNTGKQVFMPHPEFDNKYIQCSTWGQMFVFTCPNNLFWNQQRLSCTRKRPTTTTETTTTTTSTEAARVETAPLESSPIESVPVVADQTTSTTTTTTEMPVIVKETTTTISNVIEPEKKQEKISALAFNSNGRQFANQQQQGFIPSQQIQNNFVPSQQQFQPVQQATVPVQTGSMFVNQPIQPQQGFIPPVAALNNMPQSQQTVAVSPDCNTVSITGSLIDLVNGVYKKDVNGLFRRADDSSKQGLIALVDNQAWCLSFAFQFTPVSDAQSVRQSCSGISGPLDCCMLLGLIDPSKTSPSDQTLASLTHPARQWQVNILENKGKVDVNLRLTCLNDNQQVVPQQPSQQVTIQPAQSIAQNVVPQQQPMLQNVLPQQQPIVQNAVPQQQPMVQNTLPQQQPIIPQVPIQSVPVQPHLTVGQQLDQLRPTNPIQSIQSNILTQQMNQLPINNIPAPVQSSSQVPSSVPSMVNPSIQTVPVQQMNPIASQQATVPTQQSPINVIQSRIEAGLPSQTPVSSQIVPQTLTVGQQLDQMTQPIQSAGARFVPPLQRFSTIQPQFIQESFSNKQMQPQSFSQQQLQRNFLPNQPIQTQSRLLSLIKPTSASSMIESFIVNNCTMVRCSDKEQVCATARNCPTCNPMCFPKDKIMFQFGLPLSCGNVVCPDNYDCMMNATSQRLTCLLNDLIHQNILSHESMIQTVVNNVDTTPAVLTTSTLPTTTTTTTESTTTTTSTTTLPTTTSTSTVASTMITASSFLPINSCDSVKCPQGLVCAAASNCPTCNPMCFPPGKIEFRFGVIINCDMATCPSGFACSKAVPNGNKLVCNKIEETTTTTTTTPSTTTTTTTEAPTTTTTTLPSLVEPVSQIGADSTSVSQVAADSASPEDKQRFLPFSNLLEINDKLSVVFLVTKCDQVVCEGKEVCAVESCPTCTPMCFPPNNVKKGFGNPISCQNVRCPKDFVCTQELADNKPRCARSLENDPSKPPKPTQPVTPSPILVGKPFASISKFRPSQEQAFQQEKIAQGKDKMPFKQPPQLSSFFGGNFEPSPPGPARPPQSVDLSTLDVANSQLGSFQQPFFKNNKPVEAKVTQPISLMQPVQLNKSQTNIKQAPSRQSNQLITVTNCDMINCGTNLICATASNCPDCNPMCFPQDKVLFKFGKAITCENVRCPLGFNCSVDLTDSKVKCVA